MAEQSMKLMFTVNDDQFIKSMNKMQNKLDQFLQSVDKTKKGLKTLTSQQFKLNIDVSKANSGLHSLNKNTVSAHENITKLFALDPSAKNNVLSAMTTVNTQLKEGKKQAQDFASGLSKPGGFDKPKPKNLGETLANDGFKSMIAEQAGSFATSIANTYLPDSLGAGLSGAINGAIAGANFGPWGAAIGAVVGGASSYVAEKAKEKQQSQADRIQFTSGLMRDYLPQLAMQSVNKASSDEKMRIGFENLLGKNKSDSFLKQLDVAAPKMSSVFPDLATTSKQMLTKGFSTDEILPVLNAIGNTAAGFGTSSEGVNQIISSFENMKRTGSITMEELTPLLQNNIDVWGILSESTGKTTAQLQQMVNSGVLPMKETMSALLDGMQNQFPNAMAQQQQSFSGLLSTIQTSFAQIVQGPLGGGFIQAIEPALLRFADFFGIGTKGFSSLKDEFFNFGSSAGSLLGGAIDTVRTTLQGLFNDESFQKASLPDKLKKILNALLVEADVWFGTRGNQLINKVTTFFTDMMTAVAQNKEFIAAVQNMWYAIAPTSETIKKILSNFNPVRKMVDFFFGKPADPNDPNVFMVTGNDKNFLGPAGDPSYFDDENEAKVKTEETGKKKPKTNPSEYAIGLDRVPYDGYPAILHEGERVLTRVEADNWNGGGGIHIAKLADTVVVREEADVYKIAQKFVQGLKEAKMVYGGALS